MGAWGYKLYQDDLAEDVRDTFLDSWKNGSSAEEITERMLEEYASAINDADDASIFWMALADTQWKLGVLLDSVKKKALACLDEGSDYGRWQVENPKDAPKRLLVFEELRQKLYAPMPPVKKVSQPRLYKCEWKLGDIFAYQMLSDEAKSKNLYRRYLLLQKADEYVWWPGHITPVVRVRLSNQTILPVIDEIDKLPFIMMSGAFWGGKAKYMLQLASTSKRVIPKNLIYLGNKTIFMPENEYIPSDKIELKGCLWRNFERLMIYMYCRCNLKEAP